MLMRSFLETSVSIANYDPHQLPAPLIHESMWKRPTTGAVGLILMASKTLAEVNQLVA